MGRANRQSREEFTPEQIGRFTRLLRKILRIDKKKAQNILLTFELLRKIFPRLRLRIVEDADLPNAEAQAYPAFWIIKIRRGIHEGLLRGEVGSRWTFAHELGHVLLRHPGKPHRRRGLSGRNEIELQAHAFAARWLAPSELVREYQLPEEVAKAFRLSSKAARHRLWEVKREQRIKTIGPMLDSATAELDTSELENLTSVICSVISSAMAEPQLKAEPLEPWKDNLFSTSILVAVASQLVMDAYTSVRPQNVGNRFIRVASALVAISTLRPIREIGSSGVSSPAVSTANAACAINLAKLLLDIPLRQPGEATESERSFAVECLPVCDFLYSLSRIYDEMVSDGSVVLHLTDLPTYREYNHNNDITWLEINNLEKLAKSLELLTAPRDNGQ
jgi:Zn-dependent peptidase ImmA (M78 family)